MKKFYQFFTAMLLIGYCTVGALAQPTCQDSITVELPQFSGSVMISIEDVLSSAVNSSSVLSKNTFDCQDVGNPVTVTVTDDDGDCVTIVTVLDLVPPVVVVEIDFQLIYPKGVSEFKLSPYIFDQGSYDNCSEVYHSVSPSFVTCEDIGKEINVTVNVVDLYGNENSAISNLTIIGSTPDPVSCISDFEVFVLGSYRVSEEIIYSGIEVCKDLTLTLSSESGSIIPDNIIYSEYVGQTITANLSQSVDNTSCTTLITVKESTCDPFTITDTACNDTPLGETHSDTDNVEWPCDLRINEDYVDFQQVSPDSLIANYGVAEINAKPVIFADECYLPAYTYFDEVFFIDEIAKILRTWTLIDWITSEHGEYTQVLEFDYNPDLIIWNICDTKSNDTEVGDCASGHSDSDDIEWPADASALDHRILPNELLNISNVEFKNSRPLFTRNGDAYKVSYEDGVLSSTANYSLVGRQWTVTSFQNPSLRAQYLQHITIPAIPDAENKVFVTTHRGRPMPGVTINTEYTTDIDGVAIVEGEDSLVFEYLDDPTQGLDVYDEILAYQYILGALTLTDEVVDILDVNGNGILSTLDLVLLQKLYLGISDPAENRYGWKFRERANPLTNVKADYTSFKIGDIDDSALLVEVARTDTPDKLVMNDLLMNTGETYEVEVKLNSNLEIYAGQFSYHLDDSKIEILDVVSSQFEEVLVRWKLDDTGNLKVVVFDRVETRVLEADETLLTISFKALENTTLSESLNISTIKPSFYVTSDLEKLYVSGQVDNQITSGLKDLPLIDRVSITPNPASDFITVNIEDARKLNIDVFNAQGIRVLNSQTKQIGIGNLPKGIYIISGSNDEKSFTSRFIKI